MKLTIFLKFVVLFFSIFGILGVGNPVLAKAQDDSIKLPDNFMKRWRSGNGSYRVEKYILPEGRTALEGKTIQMNFPPYTNTDAEFITQTYAPGSGDFVEAVNPIDNLISFEDLKVALQIFQRNKNQEGEIEVIKLLCFQHESDMNISADELINYCEQYLKKVDQGFRELDKWHAYLKSYYLYQKIGNAIKVDQTLSKLIKSNKDSQNNYLYAPHHLTYDLLIGNLIQQVEYYDRVISQSEILFKKALSRNDNDYVSWIGELPFALLYTDKLSDSENVFKQFVLLEENRVVFGGFANNYVGVTDYNRHHLGLQKNLVTQNKYQEALSYADRGKSLRLYHQLGGNSQELTVEKIQEIAKSLNTTFVQYSLLQDDYYFPDNELLIWIVNPNGEINFRLVNLDKVELKSLPKDLKTQLVSITRGTIFTNFNQLPIVTIVSSLIIGGAFLGCSWYIIRQKKIAIVVLASTILAIIFSPAINSQIAERGNTQDNDANLLEGQPFSFDNLVQLSLLNVRGENTNKLDKYLSNTGCRNNKDCLYQLHQILIEPIAEFLPTDSNQNVVFIPQDSIYRVPFAALMDANGQYLIENYTISISPNIGIYQLLHDKLQQKATQINLL
ncbi:MAG: CHAT domain-containing protein [Microcystaceae cyanobacterium]